VHGPELPVRPGVSYLAYLAPGIMAQSALFIAIFYGIQIIWERDAGVLTKLMVTPTPRSALITGKAFASGVRSVIQGVVVLIIAALLGVSLTDNPLKIIGALLVLMVGSAFFSCLSMTPTGLVASRDRLMGIGQAITMPLFFSSSALYPASPAPQPAGQPLTYLNAKRWPLSGPPFRIAKCGGPPLSLRRRGHCVTSWFHKRTGAPRGAAPPHTVTIQARGYPDKAGKSRQS
jgi:ABC-2 type transport system permease protein